MRARWLGLVGLCGLVGFLACGDDAGDGGGATADGDGGALPSSSASGGPGGGGGDGGARDARTGGDGSPTEDGAPGETCGVAAAATWLHGEAARRAGAAFVADDLLNYISAAFASCL